jgi:hypothetical protein
MLNRVFYYIDMEGGIKMSKGKMTSSAASRIQSATAKSSGGKVSKDSFASRAQSAASKNGK